VVNLLFQERLAPGLGVQLAASLAAPMVFLAAAPFGIPLAIGLGLFAAAALIITLQLRAPSIQVTSEALRVGKINLPLSVLSSCEVFSGTAAFEQRGPKLDPRAARLIVGDIDGVIKIAIEDPADPTPYLLLSTRSGEEICAALRARSS
jgi:hypothetical protein